MRIEVFYKKPFRRGKKQGRVGVGGGKPDEFELKSICFQLDMSFGLDMCKHSICVAMQRELELFHNARQRLAYRVGDRQHIEFAKQIYRVV